MSKKIKNQDRRTFLDAKDIAQVILSSIKFNTQLVIPEMIIKRMSSPK